MGSIFDLISTPPTPINENKPVLLVWRMRGERKEIAMKNLKTARLKAISLIGMDDRVVIHLFDKATKESRGKVGLYAGYPYWQFKNNTYTICKDGSLESDLYDF